jgi:putative transposase
VCRQLGCSEASFYLWNKRYWNLGLTEIKELRQLQDENVRLKRVVADLTLAKHILTEGVRKTSEADTTARAGALDMRALSARRGSFVSAGTAFKSRLVQA